MTSALTLPSSVPVQTFWDVQGRLNARCVNVDILFLATGGINCFLDVFIVAMVCIKERSCKDSKLTLRKPIPLLWRLRTTNSQKIVLTSIFIVAGL